LHKDVLLDLWKFFEDKGFSILGLIFSPILGPKGNIEFFFYLEQNGKKTADSCIIKNVDQVVDGAHQRLFLQAGTYEKCGYYSPP
ncbi:MAG: hypothetical protein Q8M92_08850, partial [Candidatus Subteraquimicrobiales bacterium]|nr:hypothetical protein [Candidatus Subteraquimicrobiales bacterium]